MLGIALLTLTAALACDQLTTVAPPDGDVFDAPVDGLSDAEMAAFARGDAEFERQFSPNTGLGPILDRKSTRLNSSHSQISYAVFCLKKKKAHTIMQPPS